MAITMIKDLLLMKLYNENLKNTVNGGNSHYDAMIRLRQELTDDVAAS